MYVYIAITVLGKIFDVQSFKKKIFCSKPQIYE